MYPLKKMAAAS